MIDNKIYNILLIFPCKLLEFYHKLPIAWIYFNELTLSVGLIFYLSLLIKSDKSFLFKTKEREVILDQAYFCKVFYLHFKHPSIKSVR